MSWGSLLSTAFLLSYKGAVELVAIATSSLRYCLGLGYDHPLTCYTAVHRHFPGRVPVPVAACEILLKSN